MLRPHTPGVAVAGDVTMTADPTESLPTLPGDRRHAAALEEIARALRGLQFGQIAVIVQDGVVVQIDRTERHRLRRPQP